MIFRLWIRTTVGTLGVVALCSCARSPTAGAPALAGPLAPARQLVVIVAPNWNATSATMHRFARTGAGEGWTSAGSTTAVVLGRTGLAWGDSTLASAPGQPVKHEGDGKSPAGAFPLDTTFGFAPASTMSWVRLPYVTLRPGSDCVDDDASIYYNTVVDRSTVPHIDWRSAEHMRQIPPYRLGVIVGYNAAPPRKGRGSCIFLHIWGGPSSVTAGCSALDAGELESLVRWLDRSQRPMIVQLPASEYARLRTRWALPSL